MSCFYEFIPPATTIDLFLADFSGLDANVDINIQQIMAFCELGEDSVPDFEFGRHRHRRDQACSYVS